MLEQRASSGQAVSTGRLEPRERLLLQEWEEGTMGEGGAGEGHPEDDLLIPASFLKVVLEACGKVSSLLLLPVCRSRRRYVALPLCAYNWPSTSDFSVKVSSKKYGFF